MRHPRLGEFGVGGARDDQGAVQAGGVEVQPRLCDYVRVGNEFEVGVEAEREDAAGDGPGQALRGLRVAETDIAGREECPYGVQVHPPVSGDDREHMTCGAAVDLDPQDDALGGLGDGVSAQHADGVGGALGFVVDEAVVDGGGVEEGDQLPVSVVVGHGVSFSRR